MTDKELQKKLDAIVGIPVSALTMQDIDAVIASR